MGQPEYKQKVWFIGGGMMDSEFCLNSRRWIILMASKGKPPMTCPKRENNFSTCEYCGYYEKRKQSKYFISKTLKNKPNKHN